MTNKPVKLPEAGQWPDKVAPWALLAGIVLSTLGFLMAFLYAGPVNGAAVDGVELIGGQMVANKLLLSQKIFYFHMPVALVSFCALAFACYYSVRFLATKNQRFDTCAKVCMEISLVFVICTMITGDSVGTLRVGRVVDVGAASDHLPHPHAHRHRVLRAAQRHRRA